MSVTFSVGGNDWCNVANRTAALILYDLLRYGREEVEFWGELDPADVLRRLATCEERIPFLATPEKRSRGVYVDANGVGPGALVIEAAYPESRIRRCVASMREVAQAGVTKGRTITYG